MQNGDEALPNIILARQCLLVIMLITFELHHIFIIKFFILIHFLKLAGKMTKKRKKSKGIHIGHAWIRTTVRQAVGLCNHIEKAL